MTDRNLTSTSDMTGAYRVPPQARPGAPASGSPASPAGESLPPRGVDRQELEALAEKLNLGSQSIGRDLRFKVDLDRQSAVIQVIDRETGEVIREIPPERARVSATDNGELVLRLLDSRA